MTSAPVLTDAELVAKTLAGDREAFGTIVTRYQSLICSLAYSATGNLGQSEDLAQETFITAWKHLRLLREPEKLRAWLCGVARNRTNNYLRREGRKPLKSAEPLDRAVDLPTNDPLPAECAISAEEQALLWRALEQIPANYREPLVLYYREHQSLESVAAALDLSEDATKQRLSRGRKLLQETVVSFVEGTLERTRPGKAFTVGVLAALPVLAGTASASAAAVGVTATAVKGSTAAKAAASLALGGAVLGPAAGLLGGIIGTKMSIQNTASPRERGFMVRFAWMVWLLVIAFGLGSLGLALLARNYWHSRPALVASIYIGIVLVYCVILLTMILWANSRQRQIRKEEQGKLPPASQVQQRSQPNSFEYRSKRDFLGLPLIHIRMENQQDGKAKPACGWIAIGNVAYGGLFACGGFALGPVSLGGVAIGLVAIGGFGLGLISIAGLAFGGFALGGAAIGYLACGGAAAAWLGAFGGCALAHTYALGGTASALHANDEAARIFFAHHGWFAQLTSALQKASWLVWLPFGLVLWNLWRMRNRQKTGSTH